MKKIIIPTLIVILILVIIFFMTTNHNNSSQIEYETVSITKGDIKNTVWGTGSLEPVGYVDVSTEVSGTISKVLVDFNDEVNKGDVLAIIDTTSLSLSVTKAHSNYKSQKASYELAKLDYENNKKLYEKNLLSQYEFKKLKAELDKAESNLTSANIDLEQAETDLNHAIITSPTDGTVIDKVVEAGQTVAANFDSPTLFTIAKNLADMEIHVYVDESDIGLVKEGQKVEFTVPPYPEKTFTGTTEEIRLQPTTISNVVKYTAVVKTANEEGLLLPSLTADVEFIVEDRKDVLLIPTEALNLQPPLKIMKMVMTNMRKNKTDNSNQRKTTPSNLAPGKASSSQNRQKNLPEDAARVFYLDNENNLKMSMITKGATDGQYTEIVKSGEINDGTSVITEFKQESGESSEDNSSENNQRPGPPGLF